MSMFEGKVALVTGGASGIGEGAARMLAARGAAVLILDRDAQRAPLVAKQITAVGGRADHMVGDVSDAAVADVAVRRACDEFGRLDILVNNAGGGTLGPTHELTLESWTWMLDINLTGTFLMSRAALRVMLAQGGGVIVNMGSVHGHVGFPNHAGYTAAKAGIVNLTRSLAVEYGTRNIRVNAVCPGVIMTPLIAATVDQAAMAKFVAMHPMGRIGKVDEVARAICFLASDESSFVTGSSLMVDGGYTAI
jgi:NAD(P)-dependent dehydrogenase (short-subunit alcohol dehydrogenase family)